LVVKIANHPKRLSRIAAMDRNKKKRQSYKKSLKFDFRSAAVEKSDRKMLLFETHDGKYSPDKKPENYLINVVDDEDDSEAKVIRISNFL
jgi:hypothetical protein